MPRLNILRSAALAGVAVLALASAAAGETIPEALASAYRSNPQINSGRAQTRADDENVAIARAGRRPVVSAFSTLTGQVVETPAAGGMATTGGTAGGGGAGAGGGAAGGGGGGGGQFTLSGVVGLQVEQNIFQGFRVRNAIRQSEAGVLASRELLRNTVQNVLFDAAQAYMDVLRDIAILDIRRRNVIFLEEQARAEQERFNVGENTRTDVAQTRARLASARAAVSLAGANLATSRAIYRQLVGHDPNALVDGFPYNRLIPNRIDQAIVIGQNGHPVILSAIHQADAQAFGVKQVEGELLPSVSIAGSLQHSETFDSIRDSNSATVAGRVSIPIYSGGAVSARVRQAKELYGLRKVEIDLARDQVRAAVVTAWATVEASRGAIAAANEGIEAAQVALTGVQEEQRVGQRTTLDVLNAQQELLNARETLIVAERDLVVASFSLLSAMGRLTAEALNLPTAVYDPVEHYQAVHEKGYGVRTPDGR